MSKIIFNPQEHNLINLPRLEAWILAAAKAFPNLGGYYDLQPIDCIYVVEFSKSETSRTIAAELAVKLTETFVALCEAKIKVGVAPPLIAGDQYIRAGLRMQDICITADKCRNVMTDDLYNRISALALETAANLENPTKATWGGKTHGADLKTFAWPGWTWLPTKKPGNNYFFGHTTGIMFVRLVFGGDFAVLKQRMQLISDYWADFAAGGAPKGINTQPIPDGGGGSSEGTGYGLALANLFRLVRFWRNCTGEVIASVVQHAEDTIDYDIHATEPMFVEKAPIGDQPRISRHLIEDSNRVLMLEARALADDISSRNRATWWLDQLALKRMAKGFNLKFDLLDHGTEKEAPAQTTYLAKAAGHFFWRTSWARDAFYMVFTAGPNDESHDHDDQGSVTIYHNGPLIDTQNTRTRSGIKGDPAYQNTLRFVAADGKTINQSTTGVCSMAPGNSADEMVGNITPAYTAASGITHTRSVKFKAGVVEIKDTFTKGTAKESVLQFNTPHKPTVSGNKVIFGPMVLTFITPIAPAITTVDWQAVDSDSINGGYKIEVRGGEGTYHSVLTDTTIIQLPEDPPANPTMEELKAKIAQLETANAALKTAAQVDAQKITQLNADKTALLQDIKGLDEELTLARNDLKQCKEMLDQTTDELAQAAQLAEQQLQVLAEARATIAVRDAEIERLKTEPLNRIMITIDPQTGYLKATFGDDTQ